MSIKRPTKWSRTAQLPQTGYTLERRGGGEKQHNSLRLNTLWGVRWGSRTKCLPQFSALGRWGGEQFKTIVLRLVHLSTLKAIIVPASPLTAKLKFRIKMGWLDKIPKIEKKTFLNKISAIRSTNCSAFPGTMYVEHTLLTK